MSHTSLSNRGFTIIETLIATSMLLSASLAVGFIAQEMGKSKIRSELSTAVQSLEASLNSAFVDPASYPAGIKGELSNLQVPAGFTLTLRGNANGRDFTRIITPNSVAPQTFNRYMDVCTGYPSENCDIRLAVNLGPSGSRLGYAYRIEINNPRVGGSLNYTGMGKVGAGNFDATDRTILIPYEHYLNTMMVTCDATTAAATIGVRGFNRRAGSVGCIRQPRLTCPTGHLAKGLRFDDSTMSVELVCSPTPVRQASCPPDYVVRELNLRSLDGTGPKNGQCVYKNSITVGGPTWRANRHIGGRVCPTNYRSQGSVCALENIVHNNGSCQTYCASWTVGTPYIVTRPDGSTYSIPNYVCDNWVPPVPTMPVVHGTYGFSQPDDGSGSATCEVVRHSQTRCGNGADSGAYWNATVRLDVNCHLAIPETVNVY